MRLLALVLVFLSACTATPVSEQPLRGRPITMPAAKTFRVVERDGYRVVEVDARIVQWAGTAAGPRQRARIVLVPRGRSAPALEGDLQGASVVFTPVRRIAVNAGPHEAMLTALGIHDRLVAVGGTFSYNENIRNRVLSKQLRQVGYGWHSPPELDVLVASRPDVFLMAMGDLEHADHQDRIRALRIPVVPTFLDAETDYMARVDYVRLIGMLTGREREAEAYVAAIGRRVEALKRIAARQPKQPMIWAWYARGDKWGAYTRNIEGALARDAGGINLFEQPDDPSRDALRYIGTEELLREGTKARCWIIRDDQSPPFSDRAVLHRFDARKTGCLYAVTGRMKPDHNAYDYYETAVIRPDLVLADLIAMLHPHLKLKAGTYIVADEQARRL